MISDSDILTEKHTANFKYAETFHPGVFLEEELEARGWTCSDLADIMGRSARDISLIINGERGISPETAIGLGEAFGTSSEYWMNLETSYHKGKC